MDLDLSAILGGSKVTPTPQEPQSPKIEPIENKTEGKLEKSIEGLIQPPSKATEQAAELKIAYQREQGELERARAVLADRQQAIKDIGNLRTEILQGIKANESAKDLLLKACNAISLITGDKAFYSQAVENMRTAYHSPND